MKLAEHYKLVFDKKVRGASVVAVLAHLAKFCRATRTCLDQEISVDGATGKVVSTRIDIYGTLVAEGRREVYLEIMKLLNMDTDALYEQEKEHERQRASERDA